MAITKQDVYRVANEINKEGQKPSAVEVRKRLGTGSYTTITAALKEWVKPEEEDQDELEPMPDEFEEKIMQAGNDLYAIAVKIAQEQFEEERKAWADEKEALIADRDDALKLADHATEELEAERALRAKEFQTNEKLAKENDNANARANKLAGRVEALEAIIKTLTPASSAEPKNRKRTKTNQDQINSDQTAADLTAQLPGLPETHE